MRTVRCSSRLLEGGICPGEGVSTQGGVCPGGAPAPPVDRTKDACENITLPQLRCWR